MHADFYVENLKLGNHGPCSAKDIHYKNKDYKEGQIVTNSNLSPLMSNRLSMPYAPSCLTATQALSQTLSSTHAIFDTTLFAEQEIP